MNAGVAELIDAASSVRIGRIPENFGRTRLVAASDVSRLMAALIKVQGCVK